MNHRKIAPVVLGTGIALTALAAPAVASADTAPAGTVTVQAKHSKSAKCTTPKGKKINISWGDGNVSTKVYYNNHCNQTRGIELQFITDGGKFTVECHNATAKKKSSAKYGHSMPNKVSILKGKCPKK
ncbi:hypothetical protein [Actinomadura fibrosa]|uniref:Uncharacterized protein n=1 Tax=Actinomadura fibrosa TaxID=111802 RepID=A0ABW2XUF6_9ACTN|nr:hypothetical protein [Actinomadura fibrosa]